jgi:triacylglycerol lipase
MGNDHAGYDLSPDGAAVLNSTIKTVDGVYYFSYSYLATKKGALLSGQVPESGTLAVLYPTALAMGSYKGTTPGGIVIDETWQPNDGLVSVVSAQYPTGEEWTSFDSKNIEKGVWNVMPTRQGDHGKVIGLNADTEKTISFYTEHFSMVEDLKR